MCITRNYNCWSVLGIITAPPVTVLILGSFECALKKKFFASKKLKNYNSDDRNLILKKSTFCRRKGKKYFAFQKGMSFLLWLLHKNSWDKQEQKYDWRNMYLTVAGAGGGVAPGRLVPAELSIALRGRGVRQTGRHREQEVIRERLVRLQGREKDTVLKDRLKDEMQGTRKMSLQKTVVRKCIVRLQGRDKDAVLNTGLVAGTGGVSSGTGSRPKMF